MNETRQTGVTQRQMLAAPPGAVYVWCNGDIGYPRNLARAIGREDLDIKPSGWLTYRNIAGREFSGVTIDHALTNLSDDQSEAINRLCHRNLAQLAIA